MAPLKQIEYEVYGDLITIYRKLYFIYLRGTLGFRGTLKGTSGFVGVLNQLHTSAEGLSTGIRNAF